TSHGMNSSIPTQRKTEDQRVERLLSVDTWDPQENLSAGQGFASGHDFSQIPIRPLTVAPLHTKLAINKAGDEYEQEAQRVSEQIMWMPEPRMEHEHAHLRMDSAASKGVTLRSAPPSVTKTLSSPGRSLDPGIRAFMEPRFGRDFSKVRVHTD